QDFDLQRLALLNSELSKNLEQACKLAEMRLTRHCDMALAEQILPLMAEWKGSLALKSRKHRLDIQEYLEGHSESSLANFEPVLSLGKEAVTLIVSNVGELKEKVEDVEKAQLEKNLLNLSKHFDNCLEELSEHFKELQSKESSGAATQESDSIQKVDKAGEASLKKLEDSCNSTDAELLKQSETYVASWESRSETICSAAMTEMTGDLEQVKNHRRESLRKLQEKLNKLTSNVQALQAQLIQ
ncbi:MAG: hypothetical protein K2X81_18405, partial [Candidatus Obscuribacterales bacterium]|nr:hypothetical protein [Candidatus Obscuribacterales bacterium]